jgi:hypothetical protein
VCAATLAAWWRAGLWEDGYFFLRYARNTWVHGVMAWNAADGPVHGMTSQLHQLLVIALWPLAPHHLVAASKLVAAASLVGAAVELARSGVARDAVAVPLVALAMPLVLRHVTTGLETCEVLLWLALWLGRHGRFADGERGASVVGMAALVVGTYLLRPDATLIPMVALAACLREPKTRRRAAAAMALALVGIGAAVAAFKAYYGTALPLSFFVKSYALTTAPPEFLAIFWREKIKNAIQLALFAAPFAAVALVGRGRRAGVLLGAAGAFVAYHLLCTVEVMGHHSRFYLPALVPIVGAATASWSSFVARAGRRPRTTIAVVAIWVAAFAVGKVVDARSGVFIYIPFVEELPWVAAVALAIGGAVARPRAVAAGAMALLVVAGVASLGAALRSGLPALEDDETILLRQIAPRATFRGLVPLTRIAPRNVYHTDMGAPGVLLPDAKVTDLDGILNEELTIGRLPFDAMCLRDRPDAIFFPNFAYPRLREEIARSRCFSDYVAVEGTQLHIRRDRLDDYRRAVASSGQ